MAAAGRRWRAGADILEATRGINVGMSGFVAEAQAAGWELAPTLWCAASPCAHVTKTPTSASPVIVDGFAAAGPLDGIYLDLHGAMVAEHLDDGEGEFLARVRGVVGDDLPLVVSLDLHANVTPRDGRTCRRADRLSHLSACRHGRHRPRRRATSRGCCGSQARFAKAFRQLPFLIPISWQCTTTSPARASMQKLAALESDAVPTLSFAPGFPAADFPDCGPACSPMARPKPMPTPPPTPSPRSSQSRERFRRPHLLARRGRARAMELAQRATKPVVIADTQDNPGAGGDSDTTGMLRALVRNEAKSAAHRRDRRSRIRQGRP